MDKSITIADILLLFTSTPIICLIKSEDVSTAIFLIFSGDLFYDPRPEKFKAMETMGILAVEMEAAGLYGVASEYGAESLTVVTVSDVIHGEKHEQMSSEERELGLKTMVEITLESL